jgi:hypothetical protein
MPHAWDTPDESPIAPSAREAMLAERKGGGAFALDLDTYRVFGATSATGIPARVYDVWEWSREFRMPTQPRCRYPVTMPAVYYHAGEATFIDPAPDSDLEDPDVVTRRRQRSSPG